MGQEYLTVSKYSMSLETFNYPNFYVYYFQPKQTFAIKSQHYLKLILTF